MFSRLTIALFSVLLIQGCAPTQQAHDVKSSGFLGTDYARLKQGNEGKALLVYENANANLGKYDKIHLDPVTIWMSGKSAFEGISATDRQRLADDFYTALHKELSQDYGLIDQLGSGVMRVQVALTDAKGSLSRGPPIRGMTSTRHSNTGQGNCATGFALKAADGIARAE